MTKVIQKVKAACFALNNTKNFLRKRERLCVYRSLVESHLRYGIIFWGPKVTKVEANTILKLQKRALRNVEIARYNSHTDPLFHKFRILKFNDLLRMEQIVWTYKSVMGIFPEHLTQPLLANLSTTNCNLRSQSTSTLPRNGRETQLLTSLKQTWNDIDESLRNTTSLDVLKWNLNSKFMSEYTKRCTAGPSCPVCKQDPALTPLGALEVSHETQTQID